VTRSSRRVESSPEQILRDRLARGEIDDAGYWRLRAALRQPPPGRVRLPWRTRTGAIGLAGALLLLAGLVGVPVAAGAAGAFSAGSTSCSGPVLSGRVVDVTLWDMMGAGMMGGGPSGGGMMSGRMMAVSGATHTVAAGKVSFRARNAGGMVHELVVLPLPAGQAVGTRPIGTNGTVSEAGSLGEASRSCGQGAGDGILPGATSWVTLDLTPGRYELICNLPGHYAMGMFTELDVT
jgi:uncharacterized cupredoxin-like copper-binding protein